MPAEESLRAQLLTILYQLLGAKGPPLFPLKATFKDALGAETRFVFTRADLYTVLPEPIPPGLAEPIPVTRSSVEEPKMGRVHRQLLAKATSQPLPAKKLIAAAGYKVNSWSRDRVKELVAWGYLIRTEAGVRLGTRQI